MDSCLEAGVSPSKGTGWRGWATTGFPLSQKTLGFSQEERVGTHLPDWECVHIPGPKIIPEFLELLLFIVPGTDLWNSASTVLLKSLQQSRYSASLGYK